MALTAVGAGALQHCPPENSLCGECEEALALVDCEDCHESYCKACCDMVHRKGRRKQHTKFIPIIICGQCEAEAAVNECQDCGEFYCIPCCEDIHRRGTRTKHKNIRKIDKSRLRGATFDEGNAFNLPASNFVFARFEPPSLGGVAAEGYAMRLQHHTALCTDLAMICKEEDKPFVDTEPASLRVPALGRPQQIATVMQSEAEVKELDAELSLHEEARLKRMAVFESVLSNVYSWRRPRQFTEYPALFVAGNILLAPRPPALEVPPPGWVPYLPCFKSNGIFMDHFFLLALSALASRKHLLANLFVSCEHADVGMYTMQFYKDAPMGPEGWYPVTIDDLVPCGKDRTPAFGATDDPNELWGVLLQKAYAKFLGSYAHLHYGDTARALRHVSGGDVDVMVWQAGTLAAGSRRRLWWRLLQADRLGMPIVCMKRAAGRETLDTVYYPQGGGARADTSWTDPPEDVLEDCKEGLNWESGHVIDCVLECAMTGADRKPFTQRMVKLRSNDPEVVWDGAFSNDSRAWTKEMRAQCGTMGAPDEHVFWMTIDDFTAQYDTIAMLATYHPVRDSHIRVQPPPHTFLRNAPAEAPGETYNTLICHALQFSLCVADPLAVDRGLGGGGGGGDIAAAGTDATGTPRAQANHSSDYPGTDLYAAPDWKDDDVDDESPAPGVRTINGFAVRIAVSMPERDDDRRGGGSDEPGYTLSLFRAPRRDLQRPMFPEHDGDDAQAILDAYNKGVYTPSMYWQFPAHTAMDLAGYEARPAAGATPNARAWVVPLPPGYYTVVVTKADTTVDLEYMLAVTACDNEADPTGYAVDVRCLGSLVHPEVVSEAAPSENGDSRHLSPRLLIEAEQKRQALVG